MGYFSHFPNSITQVVIFFVVAYVLGHLVGRAIKNLKRVLSLLLARFERSFKSKLAVNSERLLGRVCNQKTCASCSALEQRVTALEARLNPVRGGTTSNASKMEHNPKRRVPLGA